MNKSRRQADAEMEAIVASLASLGLPYEGHFNVKNHRFVISVETDEARGKVIQLLPPQLRGDVDVEIKRLSKPQAAPTGVQSGDFIAGGHTIYTSTNPLLSECTFGFPVRYTTNRLPGILTAAHCDFRGTIAHWYGHWIRFDVANPIIKRETGKYDYIVLQGSPSLSDNGIYDIYFENLSNIPGLTGNYFDVYAYMARANVAIDSVICKSGHETGVTCGYVMANNATRNGAAGWIVVNRNTQHDLSADGDSGGPWFTDPRGGSQVIAIGIHSSGTPNCYVNPSCEAWIMPVEYIDDHDPTIKLPSTP